MSKNKNNKRSRPLADEEEEDLAVELETKLEKIGKLEKFTVENLKRLARILQVSDIPKRKAAIILVIKPALEKFDIEELNKLLEENNWESNIQNTTDRNLNSSSSSKESNKDSNNSNNSENNLRNNLLNNTSIDLTDKQLETPVDPDSILEKLKEERN